MSIWPIVQWVVAHYEFRKATRRGIPNHVAWNPDGLLTELVPSLEGAAGQGAIAEFDQDGDVFAFDERDRNLFVCASEHAPRQHRPLRVTYRNGLVCVQKVFAPKPEFGLTWKFFYALDFWVESAALLRLQGLPFVPRLVHLDPATATVEMEYIRGDNLRNVLRRQSAGRYDPMDHTFADAMHEAGLETASEVAHVLRGLLERGVAPWDIHPANFIKAAQSGRLYVVDYHLSWLWPSPRFTQQAKVIDAMLAST